jgi:ferrous iron transport protein A
MMQSSELVPGDHVRLVDFGETDLVYRRKLLSLGITRGVLARVVRTAPLGCPLQIEVRGTSRMRRATCNGSECDENFTLRKS